MGARYLCKYDDADEDCYRCLKHGLIFESECRTCPDFYDVRKDMTPEQLAERARLMKIMGVEDKED